jgi:hypothetical protein
MELPRDVWANIAHMVARQDPETFWGPVDAARSVIAMRKTCRALRDAACDALNQHALPLPTSSHRGVGLDEHEWDALIRVAGRVDARSLRAFDPSRAWPTFTCTKLQSACASVGLSPHGNKAHLIRRLLDYMNVVHDTPERAAVVNMVRRHCRGFVCTDTSKNYTYPSIAMLMMFKLGRRHFEFTQVALDHGLREVFGTRTRYLRKTAAFKRAFGCWGHEGGAWEKFEKIHKLTHELLCILPQA